MAPNKACPVVMRGADRAEVLAFRHPLAGLQLVKGSIEPNESPQAAALRELREESGIGQATVVADLGLWDAHYHGQVWSFHQCQVGQALPDAWTHRTADDGGYDFQFFWHDLTGEPSAEWHPVYRRALAFLRTVEER